VVMEAIAHLRTAAEYHHWFMGVEVMERNTFWIGLMSGIAGTDMILIPDRRLTIEEIFWNLEAG
jgi:6-phosphofructokinase